ncbi:hypothetical protein [Sphingomonas sp. LM7]|uniref:hypothetical protein n=1 Tax=Sphingomonas sp. LM7 TaxID=1938607 RepID=UPI00098403D1|nr:hypothetical protein [Sphingomonas sp. LM7]AQR74854.1 hypothetical protein BXU08_15390 [Sphingomonas sp. LM7]
MPGTRLILLFEPDPALVAALAFSLGLEGFRVEIGDAAMARVPGDACLVIAQRQPRSDGLGLLRDLRDRGARGPAIVLATHPGRLFRERVAAAGAALVEKPLIGDALAGALRAAIEQDMLT